jgi:hypothetical protein
LFLRGQLHLVSNIKWDGGGQDVRGDEKNLGVRPIDVKRFAVLKRKKGDNKVIDTEKKREAAPLLIFLCLQLPQCATYRAKEVRLWDVTMSLLLPLRPIIADSMNNLEDIKQKVVIAFRSS